MIRLCNPDEGISKEAALWYLLVGSDERRHFGGMSRIFGCTFRIAGSSNWRMKPEDSKHHYRCQYYYRLESYKQIR